MTSFVEVADQRSVGRALAALGGALVPAIGVVAFAARLVPVLQAGTLRGVQGYDDGVHLAVAQRLIAGILPYRDELFLHPPGIAVVLAPVAALAGPLGDSWSLVLARLAFMALGAVNAMLVARILAPRGLLAAGAGGLAYALAGATVLAEHTMFLETPINLGLLVALGALTRAGTAAPAWAARGMRRALLVAGLALGLVVTFKIWVVLDAVVLAALIFARWGAPAVMRFLGWCVVGAAPVVVPFLVAAPGRLLFDVVVVQSGRPGQGKGVLHRIGAVGLAASLHLPWVDLLAGLIGAALLAAALGPVAAMAWRRTPARAWPDPVWWGLLAGLQLGALALAPSYYPHYAAFAAPALCLLLGAGTGHLAAALRARGSGAAQGGLRTLVIALVAVALVVPLVRPPLSRAGRVDNAALAQFAAAHDCLWVRNPSYLQVADATARQLRRRCPATMDLVGAWLVLDRGGTVPGSDATSIDDLILGQLAGSDGALLVAGHPTQGFGPLSRAYLAKHFVRVGTTGEIEMWTRSP